MWPGRLAVYPVNMPERALTGPEPGRCYRHRSGSGPVMAGYDMFMAMKNNYPSIIFTKYNTSRELCTLFLFCVLQWIDIGLFYTHHPGYIYQIRRFCLVEIVVE